MAQFDVFATPSDLLINLQSTALDHLTTRLVAPLVVPGSYGQSFEQATPAFSINGKRYLMLTQYMAAVPVNELRNKVANLESQSYKISLALDMLFYGF